MFFVKVKVPLRQLLARIERAGTVYGADSAMQSILAKGVRLLS